MQKSDIEIVTHDRMLQSQDWYQALIEDCAAVIVEGVFQSRWILIETYHLLGRRLLQEYDNFERAGIYGDHIIEMVADDLGKSERTIYRAVQFARKYPDLNTLPGGKNISWNKICNELLPEGKRDNGSPPTLLYDGPGNLTASTIRWSVDLPRGVRINGRRGRQIWVKVWEE